MRSHAIVLALVVLAACGQPAATKAPAAQEALNPQDLNIEVGRYGVMLGHVRTLTAEAPAGASPDGDHDDPRAIARALRETAWEYNLERSKLCARGLYAQVSCGPVFEPVWLADPADAQPSLDELKARADAVGAEVQPFWDAVCADVRSRTAGEEEKRLVCAIE